MSNNEFMILRTESDDLAHHGILGMKWGVRRYQNKDGSLTSAGRKRYSKGESMNTSDKSDSSVTRRVKKDYNNLSDSEFKGKYQVSKERYRKRVNRYGDPYMNSPLAKLGKAAKKKNEKKEADKKVDDALRQIKAIDEKIKYYDVEDKDKRGLLPGGNLTFNDMVRSLNEQKLNAITKTDNYERGRKESKRIMSELSENYTIVFDISTNQYTLREKNKKKSEDEEVWTVGGTPITYKGKSNKRS